MSTSVGFASPTYDSSESGTSILSLLILQLITRDVPDETLETGSNTGAPRRITNGSRSRMVRDGPWGLDWKAQQSRLLEFLARVSSFCGRGVGVHLMGHGRLKAWLVGLVTDEVVASSPCTVNAGLFVDDEAVTRLLDAL